MYKIAREEERRGGSLSVRATSGSRGEQSCIRGHGVREERSRGIKGREIVLLYRRVVYTCIYVHMANELCGQIGSGIVINRRR